MLPGRRGLFHLAAMALMPVAALAQDPAPQPVAPPSVEAAEQEAAAQVVRSPILIIDQERLFDDSAFGAQVRERINQRSSELAAENRRIEAELTAEEEALTERRSELSAEEFRALADAFDEKVQGIRAEQDAKARAVTQIDDTERQRFYASIGPVLGELVRLHGAVVILERRSIFLASDSIDVTDEAIARVNAVVQFEEAGGSETPPSDTAPAEAPAVPAPETAPDAPQ